MSIRPGTHYRVLTPSAEFDTEEFRVVSRTEYVCQIVDSNLLHFAISPIVIEMRLRSGHITVLKYPWHKSHVHRGEYLEGSNRWYAAGQCSRCMVKENEEPIAEPCPCADLVAPDPHEEPYLKKRT